jgi:hypothetical protein
MQLWVHYALMARRQPRLCCASLKLLNSRRLAAAAAAAACNAGCYAGFLQHLYMLWLHLVVAAADSCAVLGCITY